MSNQFETWREELRKNKERLGSRDLSSEEYYADWKYLDNRRRTVESHQFRFGAFCFRMSKKLKNFGWKMMVKAEGRYTRI